MTGQTAAGSPGPATGREPFFCSRCGACCRSLRSFGELYRSLDDGSGVCRHFDLRTNLCTIYANRPLQCRVEEGYETYFKQLPYESYLQLSYEGCRKLQRALGLEIEHADLKTPGAAATPHSEVRAENHPGAESTKRGRPDRLQADAKAAPQ
ncbi:MAG: YkgJ family cysteine cluster protein [Succinivibrio sp.]|nr:YkgJ family cysteine cluster protein [Succinivibrio sp.]